MSKIRRMAAYLAPNRNCDKLARLLGPEERAGYLAAYEAAVAAACPALPDGTVLLPFPRLFIVATLAGA